MANLRKKYNCWDNAVIESFHSNIKTEAFARVKHHSLTNEVAGLRVAAYMKEYIEERIDGISLKDTIHPGVKFQYITVHRSKGLEADNVIVINLRNHLIGFPNKISDDPLLSMVLTDADLFMYAEERRLFYVAITRTRQVTYLIAPEKDTSMFIEELIKDQQIPFESVTNEETKRTNPKCNVCQTGVLTVQINSTDNKAFLGCSNYPSCNTTYKELDILKNPIKCTSCGGYMLKRKGPRGYFYGCSNYPFCRNTMPIKQVFNSQIKY